MMMLAHYRTGGKEMIKMAQIEHIKKMYYLEGLSIREISKITGHHRDTIAKYLDSQDSEPPRYKLTKAKKHPVLGPYIPIIDEILATDLTRHRKQRHTGRRIYERLQSEYDYCGGYSTVTDYLRIKRQKTREGFLPLEFELGNHAEVDWIEARFFLNGKETKAYLFVMKLSASGGFYVRAYPFEKQEAFFDGHRRCFEFMGGVPVEIAYDNLKTAVKKILQGSQREEQDQFIALRTHYLYQANFCRPRRGNEKGGVEKAGQEAVRRFLVPYPEVDSFEELNQYLHERCSELLAKNPRWEAEMKSLKPLPAAPFKCVRYAEAKVNTYSMIQFETNRYSIPVKYIGEKVLIRATVDQIEILLDHNLITVHQRIYGRHKESLVLDHYLELLLMKSRALGNTRVYRPDSLPPVYEQYRKCLVARDPKGNRQFVKILMLNREYPANQITDAIGLALAYNVYNYDGLLNILMQLNTESPKVIPLSSDLTANIPKVHVLSPDLSKYGALIDNGGVR
jgi:transposase